MLGGIVQGFLGMHVWFDWMMACEVLIDWSIFPINITGEKDPRARNPSTDSTASGLFYLLVLLGFLWYGWPDMYVKAMWTLKNCLGRKNVQLYPSSSPGSSCMLMANDTQFNGRNDHRSAWIHTETGQHDASISKFICPKSADFEHKPWAHVFQHGGFG